MKLSNKELTMISGGGVNLGVGMIIASAVIFIIGVIDGFVRPLKCN